MTEPSRVPPVFQFFTEVSIIEHLSRTASERVLPPQLSFAGFSVLNHMIRLGHERLAPARIASALQVTKGAMTGVLKRLEAEGLVRIDPDPKDGRGKLVSVTDQGRSVRQTALEALAPLFAQLLDQVDEAEIAAILPTLAKVRAVMDAARD